MSNPGVYKFDGTNWTIHNTSYTNNGLPDNIITAVAIDTQGNKWFGSWSGFLTKFDAPIALMQIQLNSTIFAITVDAQNNKWISSEDSGVYELKN